VDRGIADREETAIGIVTVHEPANHNRYGYNFPVAGKSYNGWESPKSELQIGQQVRVYYDPHDPTVNALTDYSELQFDALGPVPLLLAGIGTVAVYIVLTRRSKAKERNHPPIKP
jgi:hypothetical protein